MSAPRSAAVLVAGCAAVTMIAACGSKASIAASASSASGPAKAKATASAVTSPPAKPSASSAAAPSVTAPSAIASATPTASAPVAVSPAPAKESPSAGCATAKGYGFTGSWITVCPAAGPVGSVVHVMIKDCVPAAPGVEGIPAASMSFLGPKSWLGTNGGGGANVPFSPRTGSTASATFVIPATYTGGNEKPGPYPTLKTRPGTGYEFITDPSGECAVRFTVTAS